MKKVFFAWFIIIIGIPASVVALVPDFSSDKVCVTQVTTLVDISTPADSIKYRFWDTNGDGVFGDDTGKIIHYVFLFPGNHNVGLKVVTFTGNAKAIYKFVSVASVTADFSFTINCTNQPVQYTDRSLPVQDSVQLYTWNFGDGSLQNHDRNPVHYYTNAGEYTTKLIVLTSSGCTDTIEQNIIIPPLPDYTLSFSGDTTFFEGDSVTATIVGTNDSILWSTGQISNSIAITIQGDYWVRVFKNGCFKQTDFHITVKQFGLDPVVTTLFTPNGDGYNDNWQILNLVKVGPCVVNVFDRWGAEVFSSGNYQNNWTGAYKGKILTNDTYYYFVRCFDGKLFKGTVNILK